MSIQDKLDNWWRSKTATFVKGDYDKGECWYHKTKVVEWTEDTVILSRSSWKTKTTKVRMNECANVYDLPYYVYQKGGMWLVSVQTGHICAKKEMIHPFQENMELPRKIDRFEYEDCPDCALKAIEISL